MTALTIIPTLNLNAPAKFDDAIVGRELTALYNDAEMSILRFGAAFYAVEKIIVSTREHNSPERGTGAWGFKNWLEKNAPEISRTTAIRYRDIAEAVATKFKISDPVHFFNCPAHLLDEDELAKRAKVVDYVSDKSVRGLQLELGLVNTKGGDNTPRDANGKRLPAAVPTELHCPTWASLPEKALWATLEREAAKLAFIDWRPRINQMAKQATDLKNGHILHLDDQTKADLQVTLVEVLSLIAPGVLKHPNV